MCLLNDYYCCYAYTRYCIVEINIFFFLFLSDERGKKKRNEKKKTNYDNNDNGGGDIRCVRTTRLRRRTREDDEGTTSVAVPFCALKRARMGCHLAGRRSRLSRRRLWRARGRPPRRRSFFRRVAAPSGSPGGRQTGGWMAVVR